MTIESSRADPAASGDIERENPARPHEIVGSVPVSDADATSAAVDAAHAAFADWTGRSAQERADLLREAAEDLRSHAHELGLLLAQELGKPLADSEGETRFAALYLDRAIDDAAVAQQEEVIENAFGRSIVTRRPFGAIAAIVPWNAPLILAMLKVAPALATGNTMVVKPSPLAPLALTTALERMASHLPGDVLRVVNGGAETGAALTGHQAIRKIAFTGGLDTAKRVMAAAADTVTPLVLELGGNDAAIVLDVDDLGDNHLETLVRSVYSTSGQVCIAVKRIYVPAGQADDFLARFSATADRIVTLGDPLDPATTVGPVATAGDRDRLNAMVAEAEGRGAKAHVVGERGPMDEHGYYVEPTIVTGCLDSDPLVATEQFGPTVPLLTYTDIDDVVERANDSSLGLAASVWGGDPVDAERVARRLEVGTTFMNSHNRYGINPAAPFGGTKQSGFGREYGAAGVDAYLQIHALNTPVGSDSGGYPDDDGSA